MSLTAIQTLNAALALGLEGLPLARQIGRIIERAQIEGRPISVSEWHTMSAEADRADASLAAAIRAAPADR